MDGKINRTQTYECHECSKSLSEPTKRRPKTVSLLHKLQPHYGKGEKPNHDATPP